MVSKRIWRAATVPDPEPLRKKAGVVQDVVEKTAAFRDIQMTALFSYRINEKKVRLFGGSLDPMQGYTHCYQPKRAERLFAMVEDANVNTLRIWGEGIAPSGCIL